MWHTARHRHGRSHSVLRTQPFTLGRPRWVICVRPSAFGYPRSVIRIANPERSSALGAATGAKISGDPQHSTWNVDNSGTVAVRRISAPQQQGILERRQYGPAHEPKERCLSVGSAAPRIRRTTPHTRRPVVASRSGASRSGISSERHQSERHQTEQRQSEQRQSQRQPPPARGAPARPASRSRARRRSAAFLLRRSPR
jgi:hypothetical protein